MDDLTAAFYESHAAAVAQRYDAVESSVECRFPLAFIEGTRVLDLGCGSGRDTARLIAKGYDAFGVEPSGGLRAASIANHPELAGKIIDGMLPDIGKPFGGDFDGILCSAVQCSCTCQTVSFLTPP